MQRSSQSEPFERALALGGSHARDGAKPAARREGGELHLGRVLTLYVPQRVQRVQRRGGLLFLAVAAGTPLLR